MSRRPRDTSPTRPRPGGRPAERAPAPRPQRTEAYQHGQYWLHGHHPVRAALLNPERRVLRLLATAEQRHKLQQELADDRRAMAALAQAETATRDEIARRAGGDSVHQGLAALVAPLPEAFIEDLVNSAGESCVLVVLDQVTDPHNVGAILRSAEAFGAAGIVTTSRHTPEETGTLAKAASGALERMPFVKVTNLARALRDLKEAGFWIAGLSERGEQLLSNAKLSGRIAIVLGAEGEGLRHLTEQHCDLLVRLPMSGAMPSINVSNAAAITLYELARARPAGGNG